MYKILVIILILLTVNNILCDNDKNKFNDNYHNIRYCFNSTTASMITDCSCSTGLCLDTTNTNCPCSATISNCICMYINSLNCDT